MFSRSGPSSEGEPAAGSPGADEPPRSEAVRAFDQVLSELHPPGTPSADVDASSVTASTEEHASTLRATRDAHHEAQQMLTMASEARQSAAAEAERIVLEARDAAERARQELAGWAAAQRAKVDALAADMVESANRDADTIRAEALRTSMVEAEETARAYVAAAAEQARQDGEAVRAEARSVLHRAMDLGQQAAESISDLTTTVGDIMERLHGAREAMDGLLAENPPATDLDDGLDDGLDRGDQAEAPESTGDANASDDTDHDDRPDEDGEDREDEQDAEGGEGLSFGEDSSETASEAVGETARTRAEGWPSEQLTDRQLGSMFRRHGQRGA